ncbi:ferredoxin [Streptomyces albireticuli]|uniref:ferredoxin n=1 Tax=Streptomyces albireticuli TaxID=1940 RepID=UPI0036925416
MRATAHVDRNLCLGAGLCEVMASELFRLDAEGIAVATADASGEAGPDRLELLRDIADCCPTGAITVTTTDD